MIQLYCYYFNPNNMMNDKIFKLIKCNLRNLLFFFLKIANLKRIIICVFDRLCLYLKKIKNVPLRNRTAV